MGPDLEKCVFTQTADPEFQMIIFCESINSIAVKLKKKLTNLCLALFFRESWFELAKS